MPDDQNSNFGTVPNSSAGFGKLPNDAEPFGNVPNASETFRTVPKASERKDNHILTVREAARMFEAAGVARTERSITNWCQGNKSGVARLDAYFDSNDRKYFITPQSIEAAIKEELAKSAKHSEAPETFGSAQKRAESEPAPAKNESTDKNTSRIKELENKVFDLQVLNAGKDFYIGKLQDEQTNYVHELMESSRRVGELETRLLQLEGPKAESNHGTKLHVASEGDRSDSGSQ